jgi:hypothetical protein
MLTRWIYAGQGNVAVAIRRWYHQQVRAFVWSHIHTTMGIGKSNLFFFIFQILFFFFLPLREFIGDGNWAFAMIESTNRKELPVKVHPKRRNDKDKNAHNRNRGSLT